MDLEDEPFHSIPDLLHYLDDYITAGPADSQQCLNNLNKVKAVCSRLGLPLHPEKGVGPVPCMVVLGIELDSVQQIACLPADKLQSLIQLLELWAGRRPVQMPFSIAYKELFPIVIAARIWGGLWGQRSVCFRCDNLAVVTILNSRTSKDSLLIMHLLRNLLMSAAYFGFTFCAQHVPGMENKIADALSGFKWQSFRHHAPLAKAHPVNIPQSLWEELLPPAQP